MKKNVFLSLAVCVLIAISGSAQGSKPNPDIPPAVTLQVEQRAGAIDFNGDLSLDPNPNRDIAKAAPVSRSPSTGFGGRRLGSNFAMYRETLSAEEKRAYDQIYENISARRETFDLNHIVTTDRIKDVMDAVYYDSPELFFLDQGYSTTYNNKKEILKLRVNFNDLVKDVPGATTKIEDAAREILKTADTFANVYDKVKCINDYLVSTITYELNAPHNQNVYSALVSKRTVCAGYSRAFQYLMNQLGIRSTYICGQVPAGYHAWNIVEIDGAFYNMDVTWNDGGEFSTYTYFNITDTAMKKDHSREALGLKMPVCTATSADYWIKSGLLFDSLKSMVGPFVKVGANASKKLVFSAKFANETIAKNVVHELNENYGYWYKLVVPLAEQIKVEPRGLKFSWTYREPQATVTIYVDGLPTRINTVASNMATTNSTGTVNNGGTTGSAANTATGTNGGSATASAGTTTNNNTGTNATAKTNDSEETSESEYSEVNAKLVKNLKDFTSLSSAKIVDGDSEAEFIFRVTSDKLLEQVIDLFESDDAPWFYQIVQPAAKKLGLDPYDVSSEYDWYEAEDGNGYIVYQHYSFE